MRRVVWMVVAMVGVASLLVATSPAPLVGLREAHWTTVGLLTVGFGLVELCAFNIEYRREAHAFSISEVPTALALVFLGPVPAIVIRVLAAGTVVSVRWRPPLLKQAFNAALFAVELAIAYVIVDEIAGSDGSDTRLLIAVGVGVLAANLAGSVLVSAAIAAFEGDLVDRVRNELETNMLIAPIVTVIATGAVAPVLIHPMLIGLSIAPVAAGWFVLERHGRLAQDHRDLESVHGFAEVVGTALDLDGLAETAVAESARLLRARRAVLLVTDAQGEVTLARSVGVPAPPVGYDPPLGFDTGSVVDCVVDESGAICVERTASSNGIAAQVRDDEGVLGLLVVADRAGAATSFDTADRMRLATLAGQLAANLRKALLLEQMAHIALHDALTGDPNRLAFERRLAALPHDDGYTAVLMLDLNRFKEVNDTLGHHVGDEVLVEFSARVQTLLQPDDLFARFGGDEFAVLARRTDEAAVRELADVIRNDSFRPVRLADLDVVVTTSVGFAGWADAAFDVAEVLRRADVAMYCAKREHTNVEAYRPHIDRRAPDRLALIGGLRNALENGSIEVHYQPKVDLVTSTVVGAEALVRWQHPSRGWIPPIEFVALAEESGLIKQLTDHVLTIAVQTACEWRAAGYDLSVAVNLSTHDLLDEGLPRRIGDLLERFGLPVERLTLEITESAFLADTPRTTSTITSLSELGVPMSLDDFGTGFSSLGYLRRIPVSELKIDRSFVTNLLLDEQDEVIVRSTIDLGHHLGLQVVAEGIENDPVLERLRELGCDIGQGYGLSRPLAPELFTAWLRTARYVVRRPDALVSRIGASTTPTTPN